MTNLYDEVKELDSKRTQGLLVKKVDGGYLASNIHFFDNEGNPISMDVSTLLFYNEAPQMAAVIMKLAEKTTEPVADKFLRALEDGCGKILSNTELELIEKAFKVLKEELLKGAE